jgi:Cu(I)/Ag(I) efflux system membrane fusion protein
MADAGTERGQLGTELPEGEEATPPGARTAAIVRWALVGLMGLAAVGTWTYHVVSGGAVDAARSRYHCPMHPTVVQQHEGECPICGMDLVPAATDGAADGVAGHGAHRAGEAPVAAEHAEYTCPMHPAFVVRDPKARCPECGMKLVPKSADAAPETVPALVPVELSAERIQLIGMKTAAVTRAPLPSSLRTVGFVTPTERGVVSVTARYTGWIESVAVEETGRAVAAGEELASVYSPDLVTALQSLTATAKWSGRAIAPTNPGQAVYASDAQRDARLRAELLGVAREDVDAVVASGELPPRVPIRAPVRGHVARKTAVRGLYVTPGTELFQIADLSTVWVLADVYETEIGRIRVGQRAALELPAFPGERFAGRVTFIYPALSAGSRTLQARVELRNPGLRLRPGMYGDVTIEVGAEAALTIPADALVDTGEVQYVFVSKGSGRFEPRRVRAGWSGGGRIAVLEGLSEGERVVTTANFLVDSESRLRAAIEGFGASR